MSYLAESKETSVLSDVKKLVTCAYPMQDITWRRFYTWWFLLITHFIKLSEYDVFCFQNAYSQFCSGAAGPYGLYGPYGLTAPGYAPAPMAAGAYGGAGVGDVAIAGELPVAGITDIVGQVPILGAVQFGGAVPAAGAVSIAGSCGCGVNRAYIY